MVYLVVLVLASFSVVAPAQVPAEQYHVESANFSVLANDRDLAHDIATAAEALRQEYSQRWFGKAFRRWSTRCPIAVTVNESSGSGSTSYTLDRGEVSGWRMQVAGTPRSLIDDVIPHEVSHTVLATFYRKIIPRWADEGFASHVETQAVRSKLIKSLTRSLAANRGIAFGPMFSMTDYPSDILPLYAQGYTLTTMLIEAKDERHFLEFLGAGIDSQDWPQSVKTYYGYESLEEMEQAWKQRVNSGGF